MFAWRLSLSFIEHNISYDLDKHLPKAYENNKQ